ncbi:transglycosylase domain-containing protein [Luteipulveratus flavus]|uniref:Transglycosylase domain-containing protein n=1 Tax=Luteipulveratus flavus TaxID=3031728 RepID=A0ABT6C5M0_9MICO|nr:transglycosylase domain-containing protein [Luteipulveratus sp. YIM 133296]MDF8263848.1 transglycosylase domain-containing protein [Luteipulveratus sp. YIM 133296]
MTDTPGPRARRRVERMDDDRPRPDGFAGNGNGNGRGSGSGPGRGSGSGGNGSGGSRPAGRPGGAGGGRRSRGLAYKIVTRTLLALFGLLVLGVIALFVIYQRTDIPKPNADATKQQSILYYDDGKTELARFNSTNRESVPIEQVPAHVRNAFLSAEDRDFYSNRGISPTGIVRAFWTNLRGGSKAGGSTITQQYVKNYFLTQDRTVSRKFKEVMISLKIDQRMSKDQILGDYLNTIYFGRGAYGVQAASKAYFGKDVSQLNPSEGAFLASIVNSPNRLDPSNGKNSEARVNARMVYVLGGMVDKGWLSQEQYAQARFPVVQPRKKQTIPGPLGYVRDQVREELTAKIGLSDVDVDKGGLKITTTINKASQEAAVKAVEQHMPSQSTSLHVGLVAQRPGTGEVVAMYGGRDPLNEADNATYQVMQGASNFKVFGLIGGLQDGMTLDKTYDGDSPMKFKQYVTEANPKGEVTNFAGKPWGKITLRKATANSVNTVFLQLNQDIGPKKTAAVAEAAGIPDTLVRANNGETSLSNILGTPSVHVIDMATAYNTINNQGVRADAHFIKSVSSTTGGYSYTAKPKTARAFDKNVALTAVNAMEGVVKNGSAKNALKGFDRAAAGKTGTANENKSVWFSGFTPQLTTSVGMFQTAPGKSAPVQMTGPEGDPATGGKYPTAIWRAFMEAALQGQPPTAFPLPDGMTAPPTDEPTSTAPTEEPTATPGPETPTSTPEPTRTSEPTRTRTQEPSPTRTRTKEPSPTRTRTKSPEPTTTTTTDKPGGGRPTIPTFPAQP